MLRASRIPREGMLKTPFSRTPTVALPQVRKALPSKEFSESEKYAAFLQAWAVRGHVFATSILMSRMPDQLKC